MMFNSQTKDMSEQFRLIQVIQFSYSILIFNIDEFKWEY